MQVANCRLLLHENGSDIPLKLVTPAELLLLVKMHTSNVKRWPVTDLKIVEGQEAASIDRPAEYYDADVYGNDDQITHRAGSLKKKATYRARTIQEELARLRSKYNKKDIEDVYPGADPTRIMPLTFDEVKPGPLLQDQAQGPIVWTDEATVPTATPSSTKLPPGPLPVPSATPSAK
jgi:hypothetical protein